MLSADDYETHHLVFFFDKRPLVQYESFMSLATTALVCVVLTIASMVLSNDVNTLVLAPIEKMVSRLMAIRNDPRVAIKFDEDDVIRTLHMEELTQKRLSHFMSRCLLCVEKFFRTSELNEEPFETVILDRTITKLASLLTLGLGEAGVELICQSLSFAEKASIVNVYELPSYRVKCVMAVVRIRDFSSAIDVLHSKIIRFVSQVLEIVHGVVHEYGGAPNRNNGNTILLIWRVGMAEAETDVGAERRMSEMALVAAARILTSVHSSPVLAEFAAHPGFRGRYGAKYQVDLSFGLHGGWAIEGAVGSEFKIDASYFGPHVNIAYDMETATLLYGVPLLATSAVVRKCGQAMLQQCRLIDNIHIPGAVESHQIYSLDLDFRKVKMDSEEPLDIRWNAKSRFSARKWLDGERKKNLQTDVSFAGKFLNDPKIHAVRKAFTDEFNCTFNEGYQNFFAGEWDAAFLRFNRTTGILGFEDGPSQVLLDCIRFFAFQPPPNWTGKRTFTDVDMHSAGAELASAASLASSASNRPSNRPLPQVQTGPNRRCSRISMRTGDDLDFAGMAAAAALEDPMSLSMNSDSLSTGVRSTSSNRTGGGARWSQRGMSFQPNSSTRLQAFRRGATQEMIDEEDCRELLEFIGEYRGP